MPAEIQEHLLKMKLVGEDIISSKFWVRQEPGSQMQHLADKRDTLETPLYFGSAYCRSTVESIVKFHSLDVWQVSSDNFCFNGLRHLSQLPAPPLCLTPPHTAELAGDNAHPHLRCPQPQPSVTAQCLRFQRRHRFVPRHQCVHGAAELWAGYVIIVIKQRDTYTYVYLNI